jgi:hypothetical protein
MIISRAMVAASAAGLCMGSSRRMAAWTTRTSQPGPVKMPQWADIGQSRFALAWKCVMWYPLAVPVNDCTSIARPMPLGYSV